MDKIKQTIDDLIKATGTDREYYRDVLVELIEEYGLDEYQEGKDDGYRLGRYEC